MKEIILYHGSREGISGEISPISREKCDFGCGFYMGENELQTAGLVIDRSGCAKVYTLKLCLPDDLRILHLEERDWLYAVLANRRRVREFDKLEIAKFWREELNKYDMVIGKIADDQMNEAMRRFTGYAMTDKALFACLAKVSYGNQYVAKTEAACQNITILDEKPVNRDTYPQLDTYTKERSLEGRDAVLKAMTRHQRDGMFLNEIIEKEMAGQNSENLEGKDKKLTDLESGKGKTKS